MANITGIIGIGRDITERKYMEDALRESEEQFRSTFEQVSVGMAYVSTAVKYSPDGGKIGITINSNKQHLMIEISDEGLGIPAEAVDKIFDSFYRSKNTGMVAGTGLGLAIVKRAVDLHNGVIIVSSKLNIGSSFLVKIPKIIN